MEEQITLTVVQATSLKPFLGADGKRQIGYHYFQKGDDAWLFCWIEDTTDARGLLNLINAGKIYIFKD